MGSQAVRTRPARGARAGAGPVRSGDLALVSRDSGVVRSGKVNALELGGPEPRDTVVGVGVGGDLHGVDHGQVLEPDGRVRGCPFYLRYT